MIVVSRDIDIAAPPERVFALLCDPATRSRLAPDVSPIHVEIEGGGPLALGSRCHFRLQSGARVIDYHTRVTDFRPDRLLVTLSDSTIPFETRMELAPTARGTRLTHTESFEPSEELLREAGSGSSNGKFADLVENLLAFFDAEALQQARARQEEALTRKLEAKLDRWLAAIRDTLEGRAPAGG